MMTTHQLAKRLLEGPDVRVCVGRDTVPYQANYTEFRIHPNGRRLLFDTDKKVIGETTEQVFWLAGPLI